MQWLGNFSDQLVSAAVSVVVSVMVSVVVSVVVFVDEIGVAEEAEGRDLMVAAVSEMAVEAAIITDIWNQKS